MKKILSVMAGLALVAMIAAVGTVFYTSVPLKILSKMLSAMGVETQGITGSVASGVHIDRLGFGHDESHFVLEQFSLTHDGLWRYFVKKELNISELTIGKMSIKIKSNLQVKHTVNHTPAQTNPTLPHSFYLGASPQHSLHIAKIDISNVEIDLSQLKEPFQIETCQLRNVSFVNGKLDFESILVFSNAVNLALENGPANPNSKTTVTSIEKAIKLVFKPTYIKQLKAPVSLEGHLKIDQGIFDKAAFSLGAFDNKATVRFNDAGLLVLQVTDISFSEYLNEALPIKKINLNVTIGPEVMDFATFRVNQGEFFIGNNKLILVPGALLSEIAGSDHTQFHIAATAEAPKAKFTAQLNALIPNHYSSGDTGGGVSEPLKIELSSVPKLNEDDTLAELMYSRPYRALNTQEKYEMTTIKTHFSLR